MGKNNGFTFLELIVIILITGIVGAGAIVKYVDFSNDAVKAVELQVVSAVKSGISIYSLESQIKKRVPTFPAVLDSAANGKVSGSNPFFTNVLLSSSIDSWLKSGLSYLSPTGHIYTYFPQTGIFDYDVGLLNNWSMEEGSGGSTGQGLYQGQLKHISGSDPTWTGGKIGDALHFNGTDGYVSVPDSSFLDLTTAGTVETWIYLDSAPQPSAAGIIHKGDQINFSDEAYTLQFWNNNRIILGLNDSGGNFQIVQTTTQFTANNWYHVAATWDPTGIRIYVNGQLEATNATPSFVVRNTSGALNIGAQTNAYYSGAYRNFPFNGTIDEAAIYNRALTADEIKLYYTLHN